MVKRSLNCRLNPCLRLNSSRLNRRATVYRKGGLDSRLNRSGLFYRTASVMRRAGITGERAGVCGLAVWLSGSPHSHT